MSYSDLLFTNKASENQKIKIKKIESKVNEDNTEQLKTEKAKYASAIVSSPDFDQMVSHFSEFTIAGGNDADRYKMQLIMTKIHKGDFGYDDVGGLKELCDNNYKLLFRVAPESERIHPTFWYGIIFASSAIILRICYELEESNALMVFLNIINMVAVLYTLIECHKSIMNHVDEWLDKNPLDKAFRGKVAKKVSKKAGKVIAITIGIIVIFLIASWIFGFNALGNDIISIVSLAMSILVPHVVIMFAQRYERNVYDNES